MKKQQIRADQSDLTHWTKVLAESGTVATQNSLRMPFDIFLQEALGLAAFVAKHYEPIKVPGQERTGLSRCGSRLPRSVVDELVSLVSAIQAAQNSYLMKVDPTVVDLGPQARFLVGKLQRGLDFLLDDDQEEAADVQLRQIEEFHSQDGERSSALGQALFDFSSLAASLKDRLLQADTEFDASWITQAATLAKTLREAAAAAPAETAAAAAIRQTRNGLILLLQKKESAIRRVVHHVFADEPEILRKATSAYERHARSARRLATKAGVAPAEPTSTL